MPTSLRSLPSRIRETLTERRALGIVALMAFLPRLIVVLLGSRLARTPFGSAGHDGYLQIASNIAHKASFELAPGHLLSRPPIYPLLLVPGVLLGSPFAWVAILQIVLGVLTALLVYSAAYKVSGDRLVAVVCGLMLSLNPWLAWYTETPMPPVTSTFLMSLVVLLYLHCTDLGGVRWWFFGALGGVAALAGLTHPALLPLPLSLACAFAVVAVRRRQVLGCVRPMVWLFLGFSVVLAPWLYRNYLIAGRLVPTSNAAGWSYFAAKDAYNESFTPSVWDFSHVAQRLNIQTADLDFQYWTIKDDLSERLNKLAVDDLERTAATRPAWLFKKFVIQVLWLWLGQGGFVQMAAHVVFLVPILTLLVVGVIHGRAIDILTLGLLIVPTIALHGITMSIVAHASYSLPLLPPLVVASAYFRKAPSDP